ncbi:hypothetical protein [Legionella tucsonensis]|uniref:Coiled-coil protein n=1 Tax=Legionella tucsonensis TaxID=40335 RepID=A0A0W0ZT97_9GAMM|nr:hypothetical protein [Legionella tucsonensis]KTD72412.1 coiled-coil protein [Legionella tucsonensis]
MAYSKPTNSISNSKKKFFEKFYNHEIASTDDIDGRTGNISYTTLLKNQKALEVEFIQMFAVLQKQKDENDEKNKAFWLYCYFCATLLEAFHKAYSQQSKEEEYKKIKEQIRKHFKDKKDKEDGKAEEEFIESLKNSFLKSFHNLLTSPLHLSQIRDYVAYSNLCRVYWIFCRLTLASGLSLAKDLQILEKLDKILGTHTDTDKIIDILKAPNGVLNYFSVGFFLMRFAIDAGLLIRHTWFPTDQEEKDKTTALERFKFEFYKRHCNFANDLVWATVNFLTNFNHITHIPDPTAGALTAVFLGFDVCMTLYKCHLAKQEYLSKKAQYEQEMEEYLMHPEKFPYMTPEDRLVHVDMLRMQLKELEIDWRTKEATFYFVAAAAALLMLGFTASLLFTGPGIAVACFFVCTLAVAMYLSSDAFSKYQEKSLRLEQAKDGDYAVALKEYEAARNDFIFTMVKNTVMPTLLIATYAICWPAAIALTVLYVGYEIYHAYDQHNGKKEAARLALEGPKEEDVYEKDRLLHEEDVDNCCFI